MHICCWTKELHVECGFHTVLYRSLALIIRDSTVSFGLHHKVSQTSKVSWWSISWCRVIHCICDLSQLLFRLSHTDHAILQHHSRKFSSSRIAALSIYNEVGGLECAETCPNFLFDAVGLWSSVLMHKRQQYSVATVTSTAKKRT